MILDRIQRAITRRRLAKSLKPNPTYLKRRLAHLDPERRERFLQNAGDLPL